MILLSYNLYKINSKEQRLLDYILYCTCIYSKSTYLNFDLDFQVFSFWSTYSNNCISCYNANNCFKAKQISFWGDNLKNHEFYKLIKYIKPAVTNTTILQWVEIANHWSDKLKYKILLLTDKFWNSNPVNSEIEKYLQKNYFSWYA